MNTTVCKLYNAHVAKSLLNFQITNLSRADTGGAGGHSPPLNLEFFVPFFRIASQ